MYGCVAVALLILGRFVLLRHNCVYLVLLVATAASEVVLFLVLRDQVSGVYNLDYISLTDKLVCTGQC